MIFLQLRQSTRAADRPCRAASQATQRQIRFDQQAWSEGADAHGRAAGRMRTGCARPRAEWPSPGVAVLLHRAVKP